MVARWVERRDLRQVCDLANLIFKLNLLGLLPLLVVMALVGNPLLAAVSKQQYTGAGTLLAMLLLSLVLQSAHILLTMVTLTLESPRANLLATYAAAATLPAVVGLVMQAGVLGAAWAMVLTEAVWIGTAWWALRRLGYRLWLDTSALLRFGLLALAAWGLGHAALALLLPAWAVAGLALLGFALGLLALRPFNPEDLRLIRQMLPQRLLQRLPAVLK
jgi:O-antigen/teichoic acid export membrane protein